MKILANGYSLSLGGGVSHYIENTVKYFKNSIVLLADANIQFKSNIEIKKIKHINIFTRLFFEHIIIPIIAYREKADIIFSPKSYAPILRLKKSVVMLHDIIPSEKSGGEKWYIRIYWKIQFYTACRFAEGIIFSNEIIKEQVTKKYPFIKNKKTIIIPYGFDNFKKLENTEEKYILIPSTIKKRKNILLALKIAKEIKKSFKDKKIIITGKIENRNILKNIDKDIKYLGYIEKEQLEKYFNNTFVIIYMSNKEGYSLPIAESIFLNKKIIAMKTKLHMHIYKDYPIYYNIEHDFDKNIQNIINKLKSQQKGVKYEKIQKWKNTALQTEKFIEKIFYKS